RRVLMAPFEKPRAATLPGVALSPTPAPSPGDPRSYEILLDREILRSERIRVLILAGVLTLLLAAFGALAYFRPALLEGLLRNQVKPTWVLGILGGLLGYELLVLRTVGRHLRTGQAISRLRRYLNA